MSKKLPVLASTEEGRRFGCTRCGHCCVQPGFVFFSLEEMRGMAEHLALTLTQFKDQYDVSWDPGERHYSIDATDGNGCPLLTKDAGCSVHPVKPIQCRTFPFWDEMLDGRSAWDDAKKFCPGLDAENGKLYSNAEMDEIRRGARGT